MSDLHTPTLAVYRDTDLATKLDAIVEAAHVWSKLCTEFKGNDGTCVIGAGIAIEYLAPRARKTRTRIIIPTPYTSSQGCLSWESSVDQVIHLLKTRGVKAFYAPGRMD